MKTKAFLLTTMLLLSTLVFGQKGTYHKISPDLWEKLETSKPSEMFQVILIMDTQFDANQMELQTKGLDRIEQKTFVINELQRISENTQKGVLTDLQQGRRAMSVDDIQSFWIINGISCSMTRDMVQSMAERPDIKCIINNSDTYLIGGSERKMVSDNQSEIQWNVTKVNADDVWALGYTGLGVVVAIIDSGVNYHHTDIANNMWNGGTEYPNHGWDFVNNDNDPMDDEGHGTHCAGIISSAGTNGKQCGIAKDAKIMALKVLDNEGHGQKARSWAAIQFAVSHGADILSLSLGSDGSGGLWDERIVMENVLLCGVVASVAAGNVGNTYENDQLKYPVPFNIGSPGNCPSPWQHPDQVQAGGHTAVVTVGAITTDDERSSFSSFGPVTWAQGEGIGPYNEYPWIEDDPNSIGLIKPDISAPGTDIISLDYTSNNGYTTMSGTSQATPCVAGVMALMLEADPTLTPREIDSIIETTAIPMEGQISKNNFYGSGRIDALQAINQIIGACAAPTIINADVNKANVTLTWTTSTGANSYQVFRNGKRIANDVFSTSYTDENVPAGNNNYYVKSIGNNSQTSLPSNLISVNITTNIDIPAPNPLTAGAATSDHANLSWSEPIKRQKNLCYANATPYYLDMGGETNAAQRFPIDTLQLYAGMQIEHFFFNVRDSVTQCHIRFYEGNAMQPNTLVYEGNFTTTEDEQSVDYILDPPLAINPNKELWVVLNTAGVIGIDRYYESPWGGDAFYYQTPTDIQWSSFPMYAWNFQLGLSDESFTYNLYKNGMVIASDIAVSSYAAFISDGINQFSVTAVTNGFESLSSNKLSLISHSYAPTAVLLDPEEKLIVLPNSTLTTTTLSNDDPDNLVLESGAQLITCSENVQATIKRNISTFSGPSDKGNWFLIASPVTESLTISETNIASSTAANYDLYYFDQNEEGDEWRNYKQGSFTCIENKAGYLYASAENTNVSFSGTLNNIDGIVPITYTDYKNLSGYNLIGNPFPCNTTINRDFYRIVETLEGSKLLIATDPTIAPMEGIIVKAADGNDKNVTFSKQNDQKDHALSRMITMTVNHNGVLDNARIRFDGKFDMEKLMLRQGESKLYIMQDSQEYAMLVYKDQSEMPVGFKAASNGTYVLSFEIEGGDIGYLHLIDNLTNADIDLLISPNYKFEARTDDYPSRFKLVFQPQDHNDTYGDIFVDGKSVLIDMTGRVVATEPNTKLAPGVYILRTVNGNETNNQKIIIK